MISEAQFKSSIGKQFGGGNPSRFPKQHQDQLVFLGAVALHLARHAPGQEHSVNAEIKCWLQDMGAEQCIDHVTLRRYLVVAGLLQRDSAGSHYHVNSAELERLLDPQVKNLDLFAIIEEARAERAVKRQKWQANQQQ